MGSKAYAAGDLARRAERLALDESTRLKPNSWSSVEIRMLDLSPLGFRASCEARLLPGSGVTLDIPGLGGVEAQVEWQRGNQFGARFFTEIDLELCGWALGEQGHPLAQLLVQRAQARAAGRGSAEAQIRRRILDTLPIRKGGFNV
ncbi:MAG: hypothetical protein QOH81_3437 [Sphingomonadales bacterium]|jgi:hypothetical protein|nr:hypothetical protein [Sphingomonadales bacterium]